MSLFLYHDAVKILAAPQTKLVRKNKCVCASSYFLLTRSFSASIRIARVKSAEMFTVVNASLLRRSNFYIVESQCLVLLFIPPVFEICTPHFKTETTTEPPIDN